MWRVVWQNICEKSFVMQPVNRMIFSIFTPKMQVAAL